MTITTTTTTTTTTATIHTTIAVTRTILYILRLLVLLLLLLLMYYNPCLERERNQFDSHQILPEDMAFKTLQHEPNTFFTNVKLYTTSTCRCLL